MKKVFGLILSVLFSVNLMFAEGLVVNGNFENGLDGWVLTYQQEADVDVYELSTTDGLVVSQSSAAAGRLDISQDIAVERNKEYTLSFEYKATHKKLRIWSFLVSDNDVWVYCNETAKNDDFRTNNVYYDVTSEFITKTMSFKVPDVDTIPTFRLMFRVYKTAGCSVSLRNISLIEKGTATGIDQTIDVVGQKKFIRNGILYFKHGEKMYDINGCVIE